MQLAQPLLTILWSWLLLGEHAGMSTVMAAAGVLVCVLLAQRARFFAGYDTIEHDSTYSVTKDA